VLLGDPPPLRLGIQHGQEQVVLALEVRVHRPGRVPGLLGDLVQRGPMGVKGPGVWTTGGSITLSGQARAVPAAIVALVLAAVALRRRWPYLPRAAELPIDVERTGQGGR
jgi:hypothetical protein